MAGRNTRGKGNKGKQVAYVERYDKRKPPVSLHPLFPAIVALWFAALFGLGSLVLPPILVERLVALFGIDTLIPSAAPPLGVTARIAISSSMAIIGAMLGFAVARRVARAQAPARSPRRGRRPHGSDVFQDLGVRRPISARDELGATRLETPPAPDPGMGSRRRSLAMDEDDRPSLYLQAAPLPGAEQDYAPEPAEFHPAVQPTQPARQSQPAPQHFPPARQPATAGYEPEPLDLSRFEQPHPPQPAAHPHAAMRHASPIAREQGFRHPSPVVQPLLAPHAGAQPEHAFAAPPMPASPPFARPAMLADNDPLAPLRAPEPREMPSEAMGRNPSATRASGPAAPAMPYAPPAQPDEAAEPQHFAAPSPVAREIEDEPLAFFAPSQAGPPPEPADPVDAGPEFATPDAVEPAPVAREPLDRLSMADLAERLAGSLGRMGGTIAPPSAGLAAALGAQFAEAPAAPKESARPAVPAADPASEEEEVAAPRAFERPQGNSAPPPPVIPEALRPLPFGPDEFGEDEDEFDLSLSFAAHSSKTASPPAAPEASHRVPLAASSDLDDDLEADEDDLAAESADFGSLLAMRSPFRGSAEYVRVEEPEPADAPAEPAVVFPGHAARSDDFGDSPTETGNVSAAPQPRRFDAPGNVAAIVPAATSRPRVDRDEAERALRSALSTLQRMSGAA